MKRTFKVKKTAKAGLDRQFMDYQLRKIVLEGNKVPTNLHHIISWAR